jgi:hypothetical protein
MAEQLIKVTTRNGPAWILPQYNDEYYVTQLAQVLWANRFARPLNKKGK